MKSQTDRIYQALKSKPFTYLPMPLLSQIGSGKDNGFVASISRRMFECRELAAKDGAAILMKEIRSGGQRQTSYAYVPQQPVTLYQELQCNSLKM